MINPTRLIRPLVQKLHPYVPGEQPKIPGLIKLNTNENPYPPSPKVLKAVRAAVDGRLRLYPDPTARILRERLAAFHGCQPENIIVGNGSDELLTLAVRAFVEPASAVAPNECARATVQYFSPSYSLYPVLAGIHGALINPTPLTNHFGLPTLAELRKSKKWQFDAALTFVTTPNAPTGSGFATTDLDALCRRQKGVTVLDEAYVDFADGNALALALSHPQVLVARTFSKAYSLCFQRVGYFVGHPVLIDALHKIRDSYNVNGLGQVAAIATLDDVGHYQRNFHRIIASREKLTNGLVELGFKVLPSQTNFILVETPSASAHAWLQKLRDAKILVRWFDSPNLRQYLRITIGTETEVKTLLETCRNLRKKVFAPQE